jgi:hypothetical protein
VDIELVAYPRCRFADRDLLLRFTGGGVGHWVDPRQHSNSDPIGIPDSEEDTDEEGHRDENSDSEEERESAPATQAFEPNAEDGSDGGRSSDYDDDRSSVGYNDEGTDNSDIDSESESRGSLDSDDEAIDNEVED